VTTGGRKRSLRLLEAMERAGVRPHILIPRRLRPEDESSARAEAELRGWPLEDLPYPPDSAVSRIRLHARQEMNRHSARLVSRLGELGRTAVVTQFEEITAMQYVKAAPRHIPAVVSPYNVDSAVEAALARHVTPSWARARSAYRARRVRATERRGARRADVVICVSRHDRDYFHDRGARNAVVIPNGVDDDLFDVPLEPPNCPRLLFFGAFGWQPNAAGMIRYLRDVWPRVLRELPDAELRVAGSGTVEAISAAASETAGVKLLGFVPDLLGELRSARAVVAPLWVGGGTRIKVLEALAAARPVVGTSVAVEQIGFEHDCHGLIADDPDALAKATLRLLLDDESAHRYARNARTLAERYRWRTVTTPLEEIYAEFIERRRRLPTLV
jgi:glycosyltransferase involved in cell wall biosynthesis